MFLENFPEKSLWLFLRLVLYVPSRQGIHVVHFVLVGVIDGERTKNQFSELVKAKGNNGLLQLDEISETYWAIHCQHSSVWMHDLDLRPFSETF